MNPVAQAIILSASTLRMLSHIGLYLLKRKAIDEDLREYSAEGVGFLPFIKVCTRQRVFRNLFYYRLGEYVSVFIQWMLPPERSLHIWCPSIGPGAHFEHNYSTYLNAERIGSHFYCLQLVTLGNGPDGRPTIGDHVTIGAGAVVRRSVPANCTVVGNPAVIVRKNGQKVHIEL